MVNDALEDVAWPIQLRSFPQSFRGMKKRIGIARTLILKPTIMLYDEPTAACSGYIAEINELILKVRDKYHTASIVITHDISCARTGGRPHDCPHGWSYHAKVTKGTFEEVKTSEPDIHAFFNY